MSAAVTIEQLEVFPPETLGRDPAMLGASGYARNPNDLYETPSECTEVLCRHVDFSKSIIWEPACGNGKMVRVLQEYATGILCSDAIDYGWNHEVKSFFDFVEPRPFDIVTNPPYSCQDKFIRHALGLVAPYQGAKVVMLLRNEFDSASSRADLFANNPDFALKIVLTRRPRWIEGTTGSPRHNYAFFVWEIGNSAHPRMIWDR